MPRVNRREIFADDEIQAFHLINRCVRRTFLCGCEARYKVQPLLDEMAIAACMAYVDLNPIRAGVALTPETSDFTSVQERITDRQSAAEVFTADAQDQRVEHGEHAGWLTPVALDPPRKKYVKSSRIAEPATKDACR